MVVVKSWSCNIEMSMILNCYDSTLYGWILNESALQNFNITILMSIENSSVKSKVIHKCTVDYLCLRLFVICENYTSPWYWVCVIEYWVIYKEFTICFYSKQCFFPGVVFFENTPSYFHFCRVLLKF